MVTIVPSTAQVHWLSGDRKENAWLTMTATITLGTEGLELDTGRRFYLDAGRTWQEWGGAKAEVEALKVIADKIEAMAATLRQIQFNTGEAVDTNRVGFAVRG